MKFLKIVTLREVVAVTRAVVTEHCADADEAVACETYDEVGAERPDLCPDRAEWSDAVTSRREMEVHGDPVPLDSDAARQAALSAMAGHVWLLVIDSETYHDPDVRAFWSKDAADAAFARLVDDARRENEQAAFMAGEEMTPAGLNVHDLYEWLRERDAVEPMHIERVVVR